MATVSLKDAKAAFSNIIHRAAAGEFVTTTRHERPAAVLVSVGIAETAKKALRQDQPSLSEYLRKFPAYLDGEEDVFVRNPTPSRDIDL